MKKRIIFFVVVFFSVLILSVKGGSMVGLGAFNKEIWSDKEFNDVVMEEIKSAQKILPKEPNDNVVNLNIELPDDSLKAAIVSVSSLVNGDYIYVGPYKNTITLPANEKMLKSAESSDFDGMDILSITFIDTKRKTTYTCTQEKLYKVWELNKIATVHFLESRIPDENGQPLCYSVQISGDL